ncbi:NAD(P)-dependent oxidoreductase [Ectothiorhodospira shaposhnikovii]|uniref:SDR family oxidoreductase n=1 Tax=Ectothiorhodospira shaposhnikovii TaxID=1054 RepID=UPI0019045890|nr:SDR family oxidoreductase [Ectothiorhodospira shaposhnikovii]MBK1671831.1 NAD(P)-dependent oxidoreductase [Ectothiorhodospira shaposhnikovii]
MKPVLIMGCGYVGERVAHRLNHSGRRVTAVVRNPERAEYLRSQGIEALLADLDTGDRLEALPLAGALVLHSAPPPNEGIEDPRTGTLVELCRRLPPDNIVYISTTGVYGDQGGGQVDELTEPTPQTDRGRRRLDAERRLTALMQETGIPVVILRAPGIYGPGRLPIDRILKGEPVICPDEASPGNRIHADDLAALCVAALDHGAAGKIYNVGDGDHRSMTEFVHATADAAGLERPPSVSFAEAERLIPPGMMSYLRESRVVLCGRAPVELGVDLLYPRMEAGIKASLDAEQASELAGTAVHPYRISRKSLGH